MIINIYYNYNLSIIIIHTVKESSKFSLHPLSLRVLCDSSCSQWQRLSGSPFYTFDWSISGIINASTLEMRTWRLPCLKMADTATKYGSKDYIFRQNEAHPSLGCGGSRIYKPTSSNALDRSNWICRRCVLLLST